MNNKIISVVLLLAIVFNTMGYFVICRIYRNSLRTESYRHIKEEEGMLSVIRISKKKLNELNFIEENEFIYENEYYDISRTVESEDSITFICYKDEKETKLDKNIVSYFDAHDILCQKNDNKRNQHIKPIYQYDGINTSIVCFRFFPGLSSNKSHFFKQVCDFRAAPNTPPPEEI